MTKFIVVAAEEARRTEIVAIGTDAAAAIAKAVKDTGADAEDFVALPATDELYELVEREGGDVDFDDTGDIADVYLDENAIDTLVDFVIEGMEENKAGNKGSSITEWDASTAIDTYSDFGDIDDDDLTDRQVLVRKTARSARHYDEAHTRLVKWIVEAGEQELTDAIVEAEDLQDLRDALNAADKYAKANAVDVSTIYKSTELPTFGGDDIDDDGVFSWDEDDILVQAPDGWEIKPRS